MKWGKEVVLLELESIFTELDGTMFVFVGQELEIWKKLEKL